MGREEQVEEREVLDSIFPEEITDVSETEFRISIALDIPDFPEDEEPPKFLLSVRYPEEYPDVAPNLEILAATDGGVTEYFDTGDDTRHDTGGHAHHHAVGPGISRHQGPVMKSFLL
ncbi:hypothetical protein NLG97_g5723 [Lecanicillium saksenae]|uniref:Uncharacterized protein n=1 Tax=Lecanicillium saksenae TaxID=468837 RepID=A0ACC1QVH4_9HYPO|nr:hypothetical protein NLG97_g5723 [Lecanicillium saksenae]